MNFTNLPDTSQSNYWKSIRYISTLKVGLNSEKTLPMQYSISNWRKLFFYEKSTNNLISLDGTVAQYEVYLISKQWNLSLGSNQIQDFFLITWWCPRTSVVLLNGKIWLFGNITRRTNSQVNFCITILNLKFKSWNVHLYHVTLPLID